MSKAFQLFGKAVSIWWKEFVALVFVNLAWLACQILVIPGPPATATMYAISRTLADGDDIDIRQVRQTFLQLFIPSWKWGLVNLVILSLLVVNFWSYRGLSGVGWTALRFAWGIIIFAWFTLNLFYWAFWLQQEDTRMLTTLQNSLVLLMKYPGMVLSLGLLNGLLVIVGTVSLLPLATFLMSWVTLMGTLMVDKEIKASKTAASEAES